MNTTRKKLIKKTSKEKANGAGEENATTGNRPRYKSSRETRADSERNREKWLVGRNKPKKTLKNKNKNNLKKMDKKNCWRGPSRVLGRVPRAGEEPADRRGSADADTAGMKAELSVCPARSVLETHPGLPGAGISSSPRRAIPNRVFPQLKRFLYSRSGARSAVVSGRAMRTKKIRVGRHFLGRSRPFSSVPHPALVAHENLKPRPPVAISRRGSGRCRIANEIKFPLRMREVEETRPPPRRVLEWARLMLRSRVQYQLEISAIKGRINWRFRHRYD